jgi:hypothetical protein
LEAIEAALRAVGPRPGMAPDLGSTEPTDGARFYNRAG